MYVKCYQGNYDGTRSGMVIANNQKEAAKVVGCTLYEFRNYWHQSDWPKGFTPKSFVLYTRMMMSEADWFEGYCPLTSHLRGQQAAS